MYNKVITSIYILKACIVIKALHTLSLNFAIFQIYLNNFMNFIFPLENIFLRKVARYLTNDSNYNPAGGQVIPTLPKPENSISSQLATQLKT